MDWIFYSALMFVGSIAYYLLVKKVQKLGVQSNLYLLLNQAVPILLFGGMVIFSGKGFGMSPAGIGIVLIAAIILNYLGSVESESRHPMQLSST